jgi:hypothetical protein
MAQKRPNADLVLEVCQLFTEVSAPIFRQRFTTERCCLNATRVFVDTMRLFGMRARPLSVGISVSNSAARELMEEPRDTELPRSELVELMDRRGAWVILAGEAHPQWPDLNARDPAAWDGHLVAICEERVLVDASFSQFSRPAKGMPFERGLCVPLPTAALAQGEAVFRSGDCTAQVRYRFRPEDSSFRKFPGYCRADHESCREICRQMFDRMAAHAVPGRLPRG